jgi:hypothetical protein
MTERSAGEDGEGRRGFKSRSHGLAQKLRSLLIMIGVRRLPATSSPSSAAFLTSRRGSGFADQAVGPRTAGVPGAPAGAPPAFQTRQEAMSALTRMLHDAIGPDADVLTGRLEKAKTRAEFIAAVERCTDTLEALAGKARAQAFGARAAAFADQHLGGI